jgi:penicillin-binding protein 2
METRLKQLTLLSLILLGALGLRLAHLQILMGKRYARLSDRNRIRRVVLPAPRGLVYDRGGVLIADTRPSYTVAVIPTELPDSTLPLLAGLLGASSDDLGQTIGPISQVPQPVNVRRDVDMATVARLEENRFRLPGVMVRVDPVRNYPMGERYCHVLGHLGEVSDEELRRDPAYRRLDFIGRAGIEARYEVQLRGASGLQYAEVDAGGHEIGPLSEKRTEPALPGLNLHLTLDDRLQRLACDLTAGYARAAVVGLDARTGAVLCLVSRPGFDPDIFMSPMSPATWQALISNPSKPFFERATASSYPPGSTLKPVVALAALSRHVLTARTTLDPCSGAFRYGNRTFKCWAAHGRLDLSGAITQSCNSYFYQVGLRLGLDSLTAGCRRFGLGSVTGIDLPGEKAGNIPSRDWLDSRYGSGKWTSGVIVNLAIGQGEILATPLQMAQVYAAIAGNGTWCRPYLVERIDSAGTTVFTHAPERRETGLDRRLFDQVKVALTHVVEYGTGRAAQLREITIAGKTGTAQNPPRPDHAWFVGYAPAEDPEVVFAVLVENAGHGGAVAAPIAGALVRAWFSPDSDEALPDTAAGRD